jgi:hypothetical protein
VIAGGEGESVWKQLPYNGGLPSWTDSHGPTPAPADCLDGLWDFRTLREFPDRVLPTISPHIRVLPIVIPLRRMHALLYSRWSVV